jgi:hypothetical protein
MKLILIASLLALTSCGGADFLVLAGDTAEDQGNQDDGSDDRPTMPDADTSDASDTSTAVDVSPDMPTKTLKRVFVTSKAWTANLGGLAGADGKCQTLAGTAKLSGIYKAWISTAGNPIKDRASHGDFDYALITGQIVARGWKELTSGNLLHPIDVTESGGSPPTVGSCDVGTSVVWTDTAADGSEKGYDCGAWTYESTTIVGRVGLPSAVSSNWTDSCGRVCAMTASLYCMEQ